MAMSFQKMPQLNQAAYVAQSENASYKHTDELPIEKTLVDALQVDLKGGFDNLVRYYSPYVRKIIQDIVYPDDVDDVAQETFLRAYKALKGYEPVKIRTLKLRPWLRVIAKNTAINQYHECRNREETFFSLELFEDAGGQLSRDTFANPVSEATGIATEIRRALESVEAYLKTHSHPRRNQQIWAKYLENCSQKQIARDIGCSPDVVGYVIRGFQRYARQAAL
jgi:RNA polymerase sigma factor (sigma-70 family)